MITRPNQYCLDTHIKRLSLEYSIIFFLSISSLLLKKRSCYLVPLEHKLRYLKLEVSHRNVQNFDFKKLNAQLLRHLFLF